jgi:hypothetical protein
MQMHFLKNKYKTNEKDLILIEIKFYLKFGSIEAYFGHLQKNRKIIKNFDLVRFDSKFVFSSTVPDLLMHMYILFFGINFKKEAIILYFFCTNNTHHLQNNIDKKTIYQL